MTDEAIIEAMARAMFKDDQMCRLEIAKAALAVARPIIEAQERERCIGIVKRLLKFADTTSEADIAIVEALRATALKEMGE